MKYGECLTSVYKHKNKFYNIFNGAFRYALSSNAPFDFSYLLELNKESWEFYTKSLAFLFIAQKRANNALYLDKERHLKNLSPIMAYLKNNCTEQEYNQFLDPNFLLTYTKFAETIGRKVVNHIYIESESLLEFLTTIEVRNVDNLTKFIIENGHNEDKKGIISFAFHLPNWDHGVSLSVELDESDGNIVIYALHGEEYGRRKIKKENALKEINESEFCKLLYNSICYTLCFTDNIRDGVPSEIKNNHNKNDIITTLSPFDDLKNYNKKDITAHLRRAHFRFCGSDYYKEKKGKWVFVKGAMVGGKAQTIEI